MTLKAFISRNRVRISNEWADDNPYMDHMPHGSSHWRSTLKMGRRQMTVPFSMGPAHSSEPTAEDVLDCLLSDADGSDQDFESWARDQGYDPDSRKAERTYRIVQKQSERLRVFLGDAFEDALYADR